MGRAVSEIAAGELDQWPAKSGSEAQRTRASKWGTNSDRPADLRLNLSSEVSDLPVKE